jgi:hypothetical protein
MPARLGGIAPLGMSLALILCVTTWWHNYLSLQAVKVRNESIMRHVDRNAAARDWSVFCINNELRIPRTMDETHSWIWSYTQCGLGGEPRSIAFNGVPSGPPIAEAAVRQYIEETTIPYALTAVNPAGKQGIVLVRKGQRFRRMTSASLRYLYLKYTRPDRLGAYLESLTEVRFVPLPGHQPREGREPGGPRE